MKKTMIILIIMLLSIIGYSQDNQYFKAMSKGMELLEKAQSHEDFLVAANYFDRIVQVEKDQWLPSYHAAFAKAIAASSQVNPKATETILDGAQSHLDHAVKLNKSQSEIHALQGFIYMLRIGVDPVTRGQIYSGMSVASLQKAKGLDPANPRAIYLLAQLSYGTAQFLGSGTEEACRMNDQALELFAASNGDKKQEQFTPNWGKSMAESFKTKCSN